MSESTGGLSINIIDQFDVDNSRQRKNCSLKCIKEPQLSVLQEENINQEYYQKAVGKDISDVEENENVKMDFNEQVYESVSSPEAHRDDFIIEKIQTSSTLKADECPITKGLIDESEFGLLYVDLEKQHESLSNYCMNGNLSKNINQVNLSCQSGVTFPNYGSAENPNIIKKKRGRPRKCASTLTKQTAKNSLKNKNSVNWKNLSPEAVLPDRLKKRPKAESNSIIDLTRREIKPNLEKTFFLEDKIDHTSYNTLKKVSLLCHLCNKPANFDTLDTLFGPYRLRVDKDSKKAKNDVLNSKEELFSFVWMHRDCAIWTPNICLLGCQLKGLGAALDDAINMKCSHCSKIGATLACFYRGCQNLYHFICARQIGCSFNPDNFSILCTRHT